MVIFRSYVKLPEGTLLSQWLMAFISIHSPLQAAPAPRAPSDLVRDALMPFVSADDVVCTFEKKTGNVQKDGILMGLQQLMTTIINHLNNLEG